MNQPVILMLATIICTAAAETTNDCVTFPKISTADITVSWNKTCFSSDEYYKVEVLTNRLCTNTNHQCSANPCELDFSKMSCPFFLNPCTEATYTITGISNSDTTARTTTTAPKFDDADWKLETTLVDSTLSATWGPPEDTNTDATCATKAKVTATCAEGTDPEPIMVVIFDHTVAGAATLDITSCEAGEVTLTVTYVSNDDLPTETTKTSEPIIYAPEITSTVPTTESTTNNGTDHTDSGPQPLSGGEIAGIVCGSLAGVALIAGLITYFYCYKHKKLCFDK